MSLTHIFAAHIRSSSDDDETSLFTTEDWRSGVDSGETKLNFPDWLENKIEDEAASAAEHMKYFLDMAPKAFSGVDRVENARDVLRILSGFRMLDDDAADLAQEIIGQPHDRILFGDSFVVLPHCVAFEVSRLAQMVLSAPDGLTSKADVDEMCGALRNRLGLNHGRNMPPYPH